MKFNFYPNRAQWGRHMLPFLFALLMVGNALAVPVQETRVTGRVTSTDDNQGLPGVSVVVKGTQQGTITDAEGRYSISVPSTNATLVFSFIGYNGQEVPLNGRTVVDLSLSQSVS